MLVLRRNQVKRFTLLVALVGLLVISAAYLRSHGHGPGLGATQLPGTEQVPPGGPESTPVLGPGTSAWVAAPTGSIPEARMERERVRAQQMEWLKEMVTSPTTDATVKTEAQRQLLRLVAAMGQEVEIQGVLRSKGYADALVYVHEAGTTVVVPDPLQPQDAARVADAVMRATGCARESVTIVAPPPAATPSPPPSASPSDRQ